MGKWSERPRFSYALEWLSQSNQTTTTDSVATKNSENSGIDGDLDLLSLWDADEAS